MILVSPLVIRNCVIFDRIESVMSSPLTYESLISQSGTKKKKRGMGRNGCVIFSLSVTRQRASKTALVPNNICAVFARVFGF